MADLLIADDHPIFLAGLRSFLQAHGHHVVAQVGTASEAIRTLKSIKPDVLMVDFHMPDGGGLQVLPHVREAGIELPVIFLSVGIDGKNILDALRLGVNGLVLKNNEPQSLVECIDAVTRGEDWFESAMIEALIAYQQRPDTRAGDIESCLRQLSGREREIAVCAASAARNREIAQKFDITEGTVKVHLYHIYRKLGISSRGELMLMLAGISKT